MPEKLRKRRERLASAASGRPEGRAGGDGAAKKATKGGVSRQAKVLFTTQFATLQDAGLPVLRSLKVLAGQMPNGPLKAVVEELAEDVETGTPMSEAMGKHPKVFDELYVNMVRAGEASGSLTVIFNRLAEFMEKAEALRRRVKGAMIYPTIVSVVALAILIFIMAFVVPRFEEAFSNLGGELPGITQGLIDTARFMQETWWLFPILILMGWGGLYAMGRSAGGRRFLDKVKLKVPLLGGVLLEGLVARFARTLGTLSSSGVPLMQALEIVGEASGNAVMREAVEDVQDAVREGEPMARPMGETGMFDDIVVNMVDVGEETGELDRMLMRIADNGETSVDAKVGALVAVLEPLLIVVMALIVGVIVVALFLPLLSIQEQLANRT